MASRVLKIAVIVANLQLNYYRPCWHKQVVAGAPWSRSSTSCQ